MLFECLFGHETFLDPKCQVKIMAFFKKSASAPEVPLFEVGRGARSDGALISSDTVMATEGDRRYGYWTISRFDLPEGSFVKIIVNARRGASIFEDRAHVMLRIRGEAALRRLVVPLTGHHMATMQEGNIEGRFDIVTADQFEELGITVLDRYLKLHDLEHMQEVMDELVLEQERSRFRPPPKAVEIITESGEVRKVIRTQGKVRKINLKRPKG